MVAMDTGFPKPKHRQKKTKSQNQDPESIAANIMVEYTSRAVS